MGPAGIRGDVYRVPTDAAGPLNSRFRCPLRGEAPRYQRAPSAQVRDCRLGPLLIAAG